MHTREHPAFVNAPLSLASLAFDRALAHTGEPRDCLAFDKLSVRHFDADGRMHVERVNISKANVCPYLGREIPNYLALGLEPDRIYKLWRHPDELEKAAPTFARLQLLMLHTAVNANDPKTEVTVGTIGSDVSFENPYLKASIAVWTKEGIKLIESKKQAQLSCSYRYRADMTPGVTPEGVAYDGIMRDIMGNHVALVEEGRAGPDVYVSDSLPLELSPMFKRPKLVAAIVAALAKNGVDIATANDAQLALDAAFDAEVEEAAEDSELTDAEYKTKHGRDRKRARDSKPVEPGPKKGESGAAIDAKAMDSAISAAITAGGFVTKADADKLAADAANAAVARVNALHKAREDVKPLVGVVAMDSADDVYAFALKQAGVAVDGVPAAAYPVLVEQVKQRKAAASAQQAGPQFAADAVNSVSAAIPGLGRIQVAG